MKVMLVSMGPGREKGLTGEAREALRGADLLIGSKRLLDGLGEEFSAPRLAAVRSEEILQLLMESGAQAACVLFSGDAGFYSGARALLPLLEERKAEADLLPGISSVQAFSARLKRPWQDWKLVSAHGISCDAVEQVCGGQDVFFLTGGSLGPGELCAQLTEAGLGGLWAAVGENLGDESERVLEGTAADFAGKAFASLSVLLAEPAPRPFPRRTPGLPDGLFIREKTPMTKQEVRAGILAMLAVRPGDICWDIGAGTGSVSVELALQCRGVWAVEHKPEACALIRRNREKFGAWNLHIVEGKAPDALAGLPAPDAVFVGGSGGELCEILRAVSEAGAGRVCVSAIALETLHAASELLPALGYETEIAQIAVSRAKAAGALHLLMAQNPVFLVTGVRE